MVELVDTQDLGDVTSVKGFITLSFAVLFLW